MTDNAPFNWIDEPCSSKERTILTDATLGVPGLRMFGYQSMQNVLPNLPDHYHKNAFEFSYIVKGEFNLATVSDEYMASGGDTLISKPDEVHGSNDRSMTLHQQYWFQLDISDPENLLFLCPEESQRLIDRLYTINGMAVKVDRDAAQWILKNAFKTAAAGNDPLYVSACLVIFLEMLISSGTSRDISPDIHRALNYIEDHICEEIDLNDVADYCHLSLSRFKQKFADAIGKSPRSYINTRKIELARQMLLKADSITDVAMTLGFNNISYFSSVFKKYTLKSPREFINSHADSDDQKVSK